jgi:hypothetical protein
VWHEGHLGNAPTLVSRQRVGLDLPPKHSYQAACVLVKLHAIPLPHIAARNPCSNAAQIWFPHPFCGVHVAVSHAQPSAAAALTCTPDSILSSCMMTIQPVSVISTGSAEAAMLMLSACLSPSQSICMGLCQL